MRTTLNIADDVLYALKDRARRERRSVGEALSDLAKSALTGNHLPSKPPADDFFGFEPLPSRGVPVSNELIDRLREGKP